MKGPQGPISTVKQAKGFSAAQERENNRQAQLEQEEKAEKRPQPPRMDKLSQLMNDPVFCTDYTWSFLYVPSVRGSMRQLFVSRFYPRKQFALDTFKYEVPNMTEVATKKKLLEDHGIRYFCLHIGNSQADLVAYLGE